MEELTQKHIARAAVVARSLMRPAMLLVLLFAICTACAVGDPSFGRVVKVADGDTITWVAGGSERKRVRLYGVDAPEKRQAWGEESKAFLTNLVYLQDVRLQIIDTDRYGRAVALVFSEDGLCVNEALVQGGHAWVYTAYCKEDFCAQWVKLEQKARAAGAGLWGQQNPTAPWNWRKSHK